MSLSNLFAMHLPIGLLILSVAQGSLASGQTDQNPFHAAFFTKIANHLVACYETSGDLPQYLDEEGLCGANSAWLITSDNDTIAADLQVFSRYDSASGSEDMVGRYQGQVRFNDLKAPEGPSCAFKLDYFYSGEDITVKVIGFDCQARDL